MVYKSVLVEYLPPAPGGKSCSSNLQTADGFPKMPDDDALSYGNCIMINLASRSLATMKAFSREAGGSVHKARLAMAELQLLIWRRNFKYSVNMIILAV